MSCGLLQTWYRVLADCSDIHIPKYRSKNSNNIDYRGFSTFFVVSCATLLTRTHVWTWIHAQINQPTSIDWLEWFYQLTRIGYHPSETLPLDDLYVCVVHARRQSPRRIQPPLDLSHAMQNKYSWDVLLFICFVSVTLFISIKLSLHHYAQRIMQWLIR